MFAIGSHAVAISASRSSINASTTVSIVSGEINGSSPCTFTIIDASSKFSATSASRSLPDACSDEVITTSPPAKVTASKILWSSVATITRPTVVA